MAEYIGVCTFFLDVFPFLSYPHFLFCTWACSSLAICLVLKTKPSYRLLLGPQNSGQENFTHWNLLWYSKAHFHPILHFLGLKGDKQLSGNWTILSYEVTGELGWTRCGKILTGDNVKSA